MQSCLYGAPIMIDDIKYLCLLTVKFNHLTGKIFPYVVNLEDENGMKVSDDIMVNNNNTTTPSNSDTSMGAVTSQDNRTPSNSTANVQQNIETNKNNDIKTENKQYKTNRNMNKKLIRLTESTLHKIVKESVKRILKEHFAKSKTEDQNAFVHDCDFETAQWYKDYGYRACDGWYGKWLGEHIMQFCEPYEKVETKVIHGKKVIIKEYVNGGYKDIETYIYEFPSGYAINEYYDINFED